MGTRAPEASEGSARPAEPLVLWPVMPLAAALAAWAVATYTRDALGAWRYVFVIPLILYAAVMGLMMVMLTVADWATRSQRRSLGRWFDRLDRAMPVLWVGAVLCYAAEFAHHWNRSGPLRAVKELPWVGVVAIAVVVSTWYARRRRDAREPASAEVPAPQAEESDPGQ